MTIAPEKADDDFISYLENNRYNVSIGHLEATYEEIKRACALGANQMTHLCNAMTGIHPSQNRRCFSAGWAGRCDSGRRRCLQIFYNNIGSDRLLLITDAIRAADLEAGAYEFGGQKAVVKNHAATLHDGTLSGSVITMVKAAKNMLKLDGVFS